MQGAFKFQIFLKNRFNEFNFFVKRHDSVFGFVLAKIHEHDQARTAAAVLGLVGLLMPIGILMEVYLGASPIFVLIGAASMTLSVALSGVLALRGWAA